MTERHNEPVTSGNPMTTGEFRAARDVSASTAQFRAFAEDGSGEWEASAPARSPAKIAMLIALVIVVLAVFALVAYGMKS
jgi:hypothetical protein